MQESKIHVNDHKNKTLFPHKIKEILVGAINERYTMGFVFFLLLFV